MYAAALEIGLLCVLWCTVFIARVNSGDSADQKLLALIEKAATKKLKPAEVERYIGRKAQINTLRKEDALYLKEARIDSDTMPPQESTETVVYWIRPINTENPSIAGIAWTKDGKVISFRGVCLPPK